MLSKLQLSGSQRDSRVLMFTDLQSLKKAKVTTNSAMPETGFLTNNVASACNELVHSRVVTAVDDRLCVLYGTSFGPCETGF